MSLASKIRAIKQDVNAASGKVDIYLTAFIKALLPTHSTYLESLQASNQLKTITFDLLVEKLVEREKAFGRKIDNTNKNVCFSHKEKPLNKISSRGGYNDRGKGRGQWRKNDNLNDRQHLYCKRCGRKGSHEAHECKLSWDKIKQKDKTKVYNNDKHSDDKIPGATQFV